MKIEECFPDNYMIFDTETSGLEPQTDRILEIALLEVKNKEAIGSPISWILNPTYPNQQFNVPKVITKLTGITTEMVAEGEAPIKVFTEVRKRIGPALIYAHNGIKFDRRFINREFDRVNIKRFSDNVYLDSAAIFKAWQMDILDWLQPCTFFEFADKILKKRAYGVYFNLKFCCKVLDIDISDLRAHRAGGDVLMTYHVIEALRKQFSKGGWE